MKVKVLSILDEQVLFTCSSGNGIGFWNGEPPEIGKEYHIEIDVVNPVVFGANVLEGSAEE